MLDQILTRLHYWIYIILMMIGLYAMVARNNLIKKLIGMSIFQTAIMLFYVSIGVKRHATIPILEHEAAHAAETAGHVAGAIDPSHYANPLPHVLMLTAIVVGVATLGLAMAIVQKIHGLYGSIEEDEILKQVKL